MNKPLDPESISNENGSVMNEETAFQEETKILPEENAAQSLMPENTESVEPENSEPVELETESAESEAKPETEPIEPVAESVEPAEPEKAPFTPDSQELKTEESVAGESEASAKFPSSITKKEIVERMEEILKQDITEAVKGETESLKQVFYKLKRTETEEAKKAWVDAGESEETFVPAKDEEEVKLKELLSVYREKKASIHAEIEKKREDNLAAKRAIIEKIRELSENTNEDFYKVYNEFRKLQQQWKEIRQVPQSAESGLWKEYQLYNEKFYDLLKINNEMRDYDFKKNLELKQALCEAVEKLDSEKDVISAFYQLQNLHQEWREIGPVAKELREEIWTRFRQASSIINKKHQDHFEALRAMEQRNLDEKVALCEEIETIDYSKLVTFKDWDQKNRHVIELQERWKTIGYAPKKSNVKVFERFRLACDHFFRQKSNFYRINKENMDANLEKKKALCEKAEALKDDQNWKETADKMIALQKEWKTIGQVPRKYADSIWKRFITACDYFFEQKNTHFSSQRTEEVENLKKKKEVIRQISEIDESIPAPEAVAIIRKLMTEWNSIGFVPFRDKDKLYKEYRAAVDKNFDRLKIDDSERRLQSFRSNLSEITSGNDRSRGKLLTERDKLMRTYERLKSDIQTYENNIGFLSVSSKGGGGLVKEMNRKIENLKEELSLIVKKIEVIDENFESPKENG